MRGGALERGWGWHDDSGTGPPKEKESSWGKRVPMLTGRKAAAKNKQGVQGQEKGRPDSRNILMNVTKDKGSRTRE